MSVGESALGPGAEFDAIRAMLKRLGPRAKGVGDDAAVLSVARGDSVVASVDAFVENRHFRRGWLTPREIGRRAVVAAMSDLAAMATPTPIGRPWPSEPVATSTYGSTGVGWPCSRLPRRR